MKIKVNTEQVRSTCSQIRNDINDYINNYNRILALLNAMSQWKGKDADAFKNAAESSIAQLKNTADKTLSLVERANRLSTGYDKIAQANNTLANKI